MTTKAAGSKITGLLALTFEAQSALEEKDFVHIVDDYEVDKADGSKPIVGSVSVPNKHRDRLTGAYPVARVPGDCTVEARGFWVETYVSGGAIDAGESVGIDSASRLVQIGEPNATAGENEIDQIVIDQATGGTFTISVTAGGSTQTTTALAYNAAANTVQAALEALSNVGTGDIVVTKSGSVYTLTGDAALADTDFDVTVDGDALTPDAATATYETVAGGGSEGLNPVGIALTSTTGPRQSVDVLVN